MELSVRLAQEIVRSMHDVLHQEINFMNEEGIIIASTDAARLHQRHKGAQIVIETKKQLVIREDHRYANTRKGINMPVFFDAQVIGVIGITGEEKDVLPYGQILQKMTQILVRDAYDRDIRHQKRRSEQLWIEELLQAKGEDSLPLAFDLPKEPCCFVYAAFVQTLDEEHIAWLHRMMEAMPYAESIVKKALYPQELVLVLKAASSKTLTDMLAELQAQGIEGGWGVGLAYEDLAYLHHSHTQAKQAALWGKAITRQPLTFYGQSELGMLLPLIPKRQAQTYTRTIFRDLSPKQIQEVLATLQLYEQSGGSLIQAARIGNMHKNTVQYKLLQVKQLTGYDPRNAYDFTVLKIAALLTHLS